MSSDSCRLTSLKRSPLVLTTWPSRYRTNFFSSWKKSSSTEQIKLIFKSKHYTFNKKQMKSELNALGKFDVSNIRNLKTEKNDSIWRYCINHLKPMFEGKVKVLSSSINFILMLYTTNSNTFHCLGSFLFFNSDKE